jgi:hypothetical protein
MCKKCANTPIVQPLFKMGGLICPYCRVILVFPHERPYQQEREKMIKVREEIKKVLDNR